MNLGFPLDVYRHIDKDPLAHMYCSRCYPVMYEGMLSLCGWILKGVPLSEDHEICIVCDDLRSSHSKTCPNI